MTRLFLLTSAVMAAGCSAQPAGDPLLKYHFVEENRPRFRIDPDQPFRIELGREYDRFGHEIVSIDQDGRVTASRSGNACRRIKSEFPVEKATLQLPRAALAQVLDAVESARLMELHQVYQTLGRLHMDARSVWLQQGEREKSVYCYGNSPTELTGFEARLKEILAEAGLEAAYHRLPEAEGWALLRSGKVRIGSRPEHLTNPP